MTILGKGQLATSVAWAVLAAASPAAAQQAGVQASTGPVGNPTEQGSPMPVIDDASAALPAAASSTDIVVTAQRREQRLQEAPVAVTALSSTALAQANISTSQDLMRVVPSLQVSTQTAADGGGSATFFLRGMGQQRSGNGSEPAVGIYVDDFYYPSLQGNNFDIVDLAQVEVLRGPQGTLFGRNTIGGAIRYTTTPAKLGQVSGNISGTVGSYNRYDISGAVNLPIGDFAALRVTGGHLERDGFVKVQSGGPNAGRTRTNLIRLQARIEPTSRLLIDLSGQYGDFDIKGFTYNIPGPLTPQAPGAAGPTLPFIWNAFVAPALGQPLYTDAYRSTCFYCQFGAGQPESSRSTYKNALATVAWEFSDELSLKSLTGWQEVRSTYSNDLDGTPAPIYGNNGLHQNTNAFSQELQLNGKLLDERLNFVTGAYYYNERNPAVAGDQPPVVLGGFATDTPTARNVKSYAGYVDGSFKLTSQLSVLAGFRYSEDHKDIAVYNTTGGLLASAEKSFNSKTVRGGLQYQWADDVMTYVNVATGFRAGGFNPYIPTQTPTLISFQPEKSTSFEAGARLQFLDRRITINPTVFYVNWTNIQVQSARVNLVTGIVDAILQNAAKARSYGAELEWSIRATDHVRLFGNVAYLDLRYRDVGTASGITVDTELQRAPKVTFALGASHTLDLAGGGQIISTLNYSHQDDQYSTPTVSDRLLLNSYGLLDARIELVDSSERFSLAAFVTNLTGEKYAIGGVNYYANVGAARYDLGRPREFGLTAKAKF